MTAHAAALRYEKAETTSKKIHANISRLDTFFKLMGLREGRTKIKSGLGKEDIFKKLLGIAEECATDGWDGEKAKPVIDVTLQKATSFLKVMPLGTEAPTIGVEPDGSISLEWYRSPRNVLSVSVGGDCFLHYAALIGERKAYGTEPFLGAVPDVIMDLISQVTHS